MKLVPFACLILSAALVSGCVDDSRHVAPDLDAVNRPGAWEVTFAKLVTLPGGAPGEQAAAAYPARTADLPDGAGICDPRCTCEYTPAYYVPAGFDNTDAVVAELVQTCPGATLTCREITFESAAYAEGTCVEVAAVNEVYRVRFARQ